MSARAEERYQGFDKDPGWEARNNRMSRPQTIHQDFGWSASTSNAGPAGEIGGLITPAAEPAYYARRIPTLTFRDVLTASGTLIAEKGAGHTLIGFFNSGTLNEWRARNSIVLRINQRGDVFHCHFEYCTVKWRAGAGIIGEYDKMRDRMHAKELPCGRVFKWSLKYDPLGGNGNGSLTVTLDGDSASCELAPGHKMDGATFTHFGIVNVMKQYDSPGRLWLDDITINGQVEKFGADPEWDAVGNRRTYETRVVRPQFDFGFSPTHFAAGRNSGEIGGLFFRGDCRYPDRLASYGDRLRPLTLDRPLRASGKVSLRRGVTDSTTLIGFYHSTRSLEVNPAQDQGTPKNFIGAAIEGPSREGFYFYPAYRTDNGAASRGMGADPSRIYPDGAPRDWTFEYDPAFQGGNGRITLTFQGKSTTMDLAPGDKAAGARFDRFGLITPWVDGNGQHIYFDDLSYTISQD